ncbi:uncharacterized protein At5g41620-like [Dioscorea cayenensis subsp. rotundata]|uniref:Uncharacterized protein At5g41620-like n=1 Tax=Dioscorea cayennensis subsp. rotundata TaxID=55577 RepID=A0AB40C0W0_DIOCR|nr:uncharacterized protein At5g41620-like [Dioscorea cayenensis subsp. rotundata]XP_039133381.1 uncharacterized protein At5g41620-like [Dioscorea cayenensis subsp. rotundata]
MPRHSPSADGFISGKACKIRKRGCSSTSSSSSVLPNYRFKKAILVHKRGGSTTPVPTWKMNAASPSSRMSFSESSRCQPLKIGVRAGQDSVTARKLANALWEMNKIPSPHMVVGIQEKRSRKEIRGKGRMVKSVLPESLPPHLSDPSHSPVSGLSEKSSSNRILVDTRRSRRNNHNTRALEFLNDASLMEIEAHSQDFTPTSSIKRTKNCLKDLGSGLATAKELLKSLNHLWGLEGQHSSSIPLVSALRCELDRALLQVDQLLREQRSEWDEIKYIKKQLLEEKLSWKSKEQERIRAALNSIVGELESEKKMRRRGGRLNQKLGLEVAKTKTFLSKILRELDNERRTREMIEQFCTDLVRGIGEDKAEVEEMKLQSEKVREELERERDMLQLADMWREERVQMKLSEAKFQFEEKNAAVDQLRNELEAFLSAKRTEEPKDRNAGIEGILDTDAQKKPIHPSKIRKTADLNIYEQKDGREVHNRGEHVNEDDEMDSTDSDLHSIELNMDNNNKTYSWSYATDGVTDGMKSGSVERQDEVISINYEKGSRRRFSVNKDMNLDKSTQYLDDELEEDRQLYSSDFLNYRDEKLDEDAERYISVKNLRDRMLAGSRNSMVLGLPSPTRQWHRTQRVQEMDDEIGDGGTKISEMVRAIREGESKVSLGGSNQENSHPHLPMAPVQ